MLRLDAVTIGTLSCRLQSWSDKSGANEVLSDYAWSDGQTGYRAEVLSITGPVLFCQKCV